MRRALVLSFLAAAGHVARVHAQAGPPYLTNDPGTPGNGNWEINLASVPAITRNAASYQLPQIDVNFGVGDALQLTYEIPYEMEYSAGNPVQRGWSNAYPGFKWRFWDASPQGWQWSTFPQWETNPSASADRRGLATAGPRFFLPFEASRAVGPLSVDVEAGYYFPHHGVRERIVGLVAGRPVTSRLELDCEVYDDRGIDAPPRLTTLDVGGRYQISPAFIALFMAGHSIGGSDAGRQTIGYVGLQILLTHDGAALAR